MNSRSDRGQATVLTLVFLVVLLGMAALVLDIGSWYRADRATQNDGRRRGARGRSGSPVGSGQREHTRAPVHDQERRRHSHRHPLVQVRHQRHGQGQRDSSRAGHLHEAVWRRTVTVGSHATARASLMDQAKYVAPIGVNIHNPKLKGTATCPCFGSGRT